VAVPRAPPPRMAVRPACKYPNPLRARDPALCLGGAPFPRGRVHACARAYTRRPTDAVLIECVGAVRPAADMQPPPVPPEGVDRLRAPAARCSRGAGAAAPGCGEQGHSAAGPGGAQLPRECNLCEGTLAQLDGELVRAAASGDAELIALLVRHGALVNAATAVPAGRLIFPLDCVGWAPIHYAAASGHCDSIYLLWQLGADAARATPFHHWTPLHLAAAFGHAKAAGSGALGQEHARACAAASGFSGLRGSRRTLACCTWWQTCLASCSTCVCVPACACEGAFRVVRLPRVSQCVYARAHTRTRTRARAHTHTHTHTCTHAHVHTNTRARTHTPVGHARMCAPWQKCYSTSGARWMRELQGTAMLPVC